MKRYKTADEFMDVQEQWKAELQLLRTILLDTGLDEQIKWGSPCYVHKGKNIAGLGSFKSYFGIWFFQGALLSDSLGKLMNAQEGKTHAMRQWRMASMEEIDRDLIHAYIQESIENFAAGRVIKPKKKEAKEISVPEELNNAFRENEALLDCFESLSPYKQREYKEYIGEAKRAETRLKRLEKVRPMILNQQGLNDKYR